MIVLLFVLEVPVHSRLVCITSTYLNSTIMAAQTSSNLRCVVFMKSGNSTINWSFVVNISFNTPPNTLVTFCPVSSPSQCHTCTDILLATRTRAHTVGREDVEADVHALAEAGAAVERAEQLVVGVAHVVRHAAVAQTLLLHRTHHGAAHEHLHVVPARALFGIAAATAHAVRLVDNTSDRFAPQLHRKHGKWWIFQSKEP